MKFLSRFYIFIIFAILYAPILVVILFSFNASGNLSNFSGFTLGWYAELFRDGQAIEALKNSIIIAVASSLFATIMGTFAAFSIAHSKNKYYQKIMKSVSNIPMMNPDIVTGISLMLLFVFAGVMLNKRDVLGFWTILIAHVTFQLPYVILSVLPKLRQTDRNLAEAAQDLGCNSISVITKIVLPLSFPGILTGITMTFVPAVSTFVISGLLGGSNCFLIGDLIQQQFLGNEYNLNYGAATSLFLMAVVFISMGIFNSFDNDEMEDSMV